METDKASVDYEMTENLYIAKILKGNTKDKLKVGEIIGYSVSTKEELANFKVPEEAISE